MIRYAKGAGKRGVGTRTKARHFVIGWTTLVAVLAGILVLVPVGQAAPLPHLGSFAEQLRGPSRLAVAPDDTIFVCDPLSNHIVRFDAAGNVLNVHVVPQGPIGVAVHPDGRIFVSLREVAKVAVHGAAFEFLEYLGDSEPLVTFVNPTDIDIATDTGRIHVVDAAGDRIYAFNSDGSLALILSSRGSWPGEVLYPSAITIDEPRNRVIIADHDKFRLQVFTSAGVLLKQFGGRTKPAGAFDEGWMPRPLGLTVDGEGRIFISDALMGTVRVFDHTGVELGKVVDYGEQPGDLRIPCDLAISNDGARLYVVSIGNSRVEVYDLTGTELAGAATSTTDPVLDEAYESGVIAAPLAHDDWLSGPHRVEERADLCEPCHSITGQPGAHGGTVEGQTVICLSCHNPGGRALNVPIYIRDLADPFGTNPTAADGRGRSHAWGVPAVNSLADSVGPLPGGMSSFLDRDGNIKCSTCHNQHDTTYGPSYLRVSNEADAMCKQCHAPRDRGVGEGGSHPVGFVYPAGDGEYPTDDLLGPLFIKDGKLECMTCHAPHGADSGGANGGDGDGMLLRNANDETLCRTCHTEHIAHQVSGDWQPTCHECHSVHDVENENAALIAREINGTPVRFAEDTACGSAGEYIHGSCDPPSYDGVCEVCHTDTDYHRNNPELDHAHQSDVRCTDCHLHSLGFLTSCTTCHGEPPDGIESPNRAGSHEFHLTTAHGPQIADCSVCHAPEDADTHDNELISFASGGDANLDGNIDLSEADVCDACHGLGGPFDGVNDPRIGAKANWYTGVYDGTVLKADKADWCAGCHDLTAASVNNVDAPSTMGDNAAWGYNVSGHGLNEILCTDCHDPTLPHTDGAHRTFLEWCDRFPLPPADDDQYADQRELAKQVYNTGYRLRTVDGGRALEIPRDSVEYTSDDFRLCFSCHDEVKMLGVPADYGSFFATPPPHLQLPPGVAQTNYRNEFRLGFGWTWHLLKPGNAHWDHLSMDEIGWNIDHNETIQDSRFSCVTCHNPHGARDLKGNPTAARMVGDLAIDFGIYDDDGTLREYGFIQTGEYFAPGGDLHCDSCHTFSGPGPEYPAPGSHSRYYREWLDLSGSATPEREESAPARDVGKRRREEPK